MAFAPVVMYCMALVIATASTVLPLLSTPAIVICIYSSAMLISNAIVQYRNT